MKKLHISLIFSNLEVKIKTLNYISLMYNFIAKFYIILDVCKSFAKNQVNDKGNMTRPGVVPKFSDLEVIALSITAEACGIDSENLLFNRLNNECPGKIPNLISRRQFNVRRKKTMYLGEDIRKLIANHMDGGEFLFAIDSKPIKVCQNVRAKRCTMGKEDFEHAPAWGYCASQNTHYYGYKIHAVCGTRGIIHSYDLTAANVHDLHFLKDVQWQYHDCHMLGDKGYLSAEVQQNLFESCNIVLEVPYRLNQKYWQPTSWTYKKYRKRIETVFSQLNDHLMMLRNYAKQTYGLFTRIAAKISAFTMLQYFNFINHKPIGQVKYALF